MLIKILDEDTENSESIVARKNILKNYSTQSKLLVPEDKNKRLIDTAFLPIPQKLPGIIDLTSSDNKHTNDVLHHNFIINREYTVNEACTLLQTPNQTTSGIIMDSIIAIIRCKVRNSVFIAYSSITNRLDSGSEIPWLRLGGFFSDEYAERKVNGWYLFPLFKEASAGAVGHWSLIIVEKRGRTYNGWYLDSLHEYIPADFQNSYKAKIEHSMREGGTFRWFSVHGAKQQELECGARTIWALIQFSVGISCRKSTDDCVNMACMENFSSDFSATWKARILAADFINNPDLCWEKLIQEFSSHDLNPPNSEITRGGAAGRKRMARQLSQRTKKVCFR